MQGGSLSTLSRLATCKDLGDIFLQSCASGQYKIFYWCLAQSPELKNHHGKRGETALHVAGSAGHAAIVRRLIELTPVIDAKDDDGRTPLANAALAGEVEIVELLLRHGARANETTGDDRSILMALACEDKPPRVREVVRILLKNGADPNVPARDAWIPTPLLKAASKRSLGMVKSLLEHRGTNQVEPNVTGKWGWNALHFLADADPGSDGGEVTTKIAGLLIVAGINPLERDDEGWIPLHIAARSGNLPLLQFLWDKHPESLLTMMMGGQWLTLDAAIPM